MRPFAATGDIARYFILYKFRDTPYLLRTQSYLQCTQINNYTVHYCADDVLDRHKKQPLKGIYYPAAQCNKAALFTT